jgi:hypothetical protein
MTTVTGSNTTSVNKDNTTTTSTVCCNTVVCHNDRTCHAQTCLRPKREQHDDDRNSNKVMKQQQGNDNNSSNMVMYRMYNDHNSSNMVTTTSAPTQFGAYLLLQRLHLSDTFVQHVQRLLLSVNEGRALFCCALRLFHVGESVNGTGKHVQARGDERATPYTRSHTHTHTESPTTTHRHTHARLVPIWGIYKRITNTSKIRSDLFATRRGKQDFRRFSLPWPAAREVLRHRPTVHHRTR